MVKDVRKQILQISKFFGFFYGIFVLMTTNIATNHLKKTIYNGLQPKHASRCHGTKRSTERLA